MTAKIKSIKKLFTNDFGELLKNGCSNNNQQFIEKFFEETDMKTLGYDEILDLEDIIYDSISNATSAICFIPHDKTGLIINISEYCGILRAIQGMLDRRHEEFDFELVGQQPHADSIIKCLTNEGEVWRDELIAHHIHAELEKVKPALSWLEEFGFITHTRPGKYKYYYLTQKGEKYFDENELPF